MKVYSQQIIQDYFVNKSYFAFILEGYFIRYKILERFCFCFCFFSVSTFNRWFHCILVSVVSDENLAVTGIIIPLNIMAYFSKATFKIFFLSLVYSIRCDVPWHHACFVGVLLTVPQLFSGF